MLNLITGLDNAIVDLQNDIKKIDQEITNIYQDIKNINKEITNIKNDITNIYNQLSALTGGGDFKRLTKDKDYKVTFFNGFYTETGDVFVGYIKTQDGVLLNIKQINVANSLYNKDLLKVKMSHGNKVNDVPESMILSIEFLGNFKDWNNYTTKAYNQNASLIWNIRPIALRASWAVSYGLGRNVNNNPFLFHITSYADGYNTQFSVYNSQDIRLEGGNFGATITLLDPNYKEEETEETEEETKEEGTVKWQAGLQEMLLQKHQ